MDCKLELHLLVLLSARYSGMGDSFCTFEEMMNLHIGKILAVANIRKVGFNTTDEKGS